MTSLSSYPIILCLATVNSESAYGISRGAQMTLASSTSEITGVAQMLCEAWWIISKSGTERLVIAMAR